MGRCYPLQIGCAEALDRFHAALVVIIRQTKTAQHNPALGPLGAGLVCVGHQAFELGTSQVEIVVAEGHGTQLPPTLLQQSQRQFGALCPC